MMNFLKLKKNKKEAFIIALLSVFLCVLIVFEIRFIYISGRLPFAHSIFFFGIVNLNIILLIFLFLFIFRNLAKTFVRKKGRFIGGSLRSKLVIAFVSFSLIPTLLLFFISVIYIKSSFDKWFNLQMTGVLKKSLELSQYHYFNIKKKNYHFASLVSKKLFSENQSIKKTPRHLNVFKKEFDLDSIEYYYFNPNKTDKKIRRIQSDLSSSFSHLPVLSEDVLRKSIHDVSETSIIQPVSEGSWVRVIVPVSRSLYGRAQFPTGVIVVSSFMSLSLLSQLEEVSFAYEEIRGVNPLEFPLKSIYLTMLILMTLIIVFCAIWIGFYMARQLSSPLSALGTATARIAHGDYRPIRLNTGTDEFTQLVDRFNYMAETLKYSENEIKSTNKYLKRAISDLHNRSTYLEVVLRNVNTGVISIDEEEKITTINQHAAKLLNIKSEDFLFLPLNNLLNEKFYKTIKEMLSHIIKRDLLFVKKDRHLYMKDREIPIQITLSLLKSERGDVIGKILVFDDLTAFFESQKLAAWREVAKRIAHEIKNPLTPIKLSAERLRKKFSQDLKSATFDSCVQMIIEQTEQIKGLVNEFNYFSRLPKIQPILADFNKEVREILDFYQQGHSHCHFEFKTDPHFSSFLFDVEQMKRVIINLCQNSLIACQKRKEPKIQLKTSFDVHKNILRLDFTDNGEGISLQHREKIFQPHFTSKKVGGSGLGLAIVRRIVEDHKGKVYLAKSQPVQGTRIIIEIPVMRLESKNKDENIFVPEKNSENYG